MSEALNIPPTPEGTQESRVLWDQVLRAYSEMSELDGELDLFWILDNLDGEDEQAAYDELLGNYLMLTVPEGENANLDRIKDFLRGVGILEEGSDEI